MYEHTKLSFKRKLIAVKLKDGICTECAESSGLKVTGIFVILLSQDDFESNSPEAKFQTITSQNQFEKVTVQKPIADFWTGISNQMIKYQLPHTRFSHISDHQHYIYCNGKLSTKILEQTANKNTKFMLTKAGRLVLEVTVSKNSK